MSDRPDDHQALPPGNDNDTPVEKNLAEAPVRINYDEPPTKSPPLLEKGVFAWMRTNLFRTPFDTILTLVSIVIIIGVITSFLEWAISDGNWFAITFNFRRFMVGRFEETALFGIQALYDWRISAFMLLIAITAGSAIAAYTRRIPAMTGAILVGFVAFIAVAPLLINFLTDRPSAYMLAGNTDIVSGTATETPLNQVAFIAAADEQIVMTYADLAGLDDILLTSPGFYDDAANLVRNSALRRVETLEQAQLVNERIIADDDIRTERDLDIGTLTSNQRAELEDLIDDLAYEPPEADLARIDEITVLLEADAEAREDGREDSREDSNENADGLLPDAERNALEAERLRLQIRPPVAEALALNTQPITVTILDQTLEPVSEPRTLAVGESVQVNIPADGWYVLQKTAIGDDDTVALLGIEGIYPTLETGGNFKRVTDNFTVSAPRPRVDDEELPYVNVIENQYRGERPLDDYLSVYLAPFLSLITPGLIGITIAMILGYFGTKAADVRLQPGAPPRKTAQRIANILLVSSPFLLFIFINGINLLALIFIGGWFAWNSFVYHLGKRLSLLTVEPGDVPGKNGRGAMVSTFGTLAVLILSVVIMSTSMSVANADNAPGPLQLVILGALYIPPVALYWYGTTQQVVNMKVEDQRKLMRRLYTMGGLALAGFFIPAIYVMLGLPTGDDSVVTFFAVTDSRRWGGLLLAMVITVWGIIIAFPLGVGLALGRRSNLPAIKYLCTIIIEMVRGTPFIVVLFAGQLLIPLINPAFAEIPNVYRALAATIIFIAAYLAENVRGGLQSIPPGQDEAARAIGLTGWQATLYITLPQALRAVIPALVGQFISLFKDTSLLAIVGLIDLTGVVNSVVVQPEFIGTRREGLLFISIIYFAISYVMSYVSRRLEESGSGSARRL